ncbi:MAG TPA: 6-bladed beta-propeller [Candidatus Kapabacteria bacterium]|nr:6-bladed beta-propeller [Candidatus Kapabacteria bacterium]
MNRTFVLVMILMLSMTGSLMGGDLIEHYKKGIVTLKGETDFGKNTDWETLFYDRYRELIIAPDGSIFVANNRQDNFYKFDKQGNFIKKFGQKGEGPGDVYSPGELTILDNKYLVAGDYALRRRITIWDLNGNCQKVVKTNKSPFYLTSLKENKLAYLTFSQHAETKNGYLRIIQIIIKDIVTGREKTIREISLLDRSEIIVGENMSTGVGNFFGGVFLARTSDGNLVVGISNLPRIEIFSPSGEIIFSFNLKINPIPVDSAYIKKFRDHTLSELYSKNEASMDSTNKFWHDVKKKAFQTFDFSKVFDKHLPLYYEILVDSDGNFLVFKYTDCLKDCKTFFQVYSKKGEFICETEFDKGIYDFEIDTRFKNISFTTEGIFGLFMNKGDEKEVLRLIKSKY